MKKTIMGVLAAITVLLLAACGGQKDTVDALGADVQQTGAAVQTTEAAADGEAAGETDTVPAETEPAAEETTVPAEPEPEAPFDNSWASNAFEKQIPQLPFAEWTADESQTGNSYNIIVKNANSDDVMTYGELLYTTAFTVDVELSDHPKEYTLFAKNEAGYSLNYMFYATKWDAETIIGELRIDIHKPQ